MRPEYALARAAPEIGQYAARLPGGVLVTWEDSDAGFAMAGAPNWCRDLVMCKWAGADYRLTIPIGAGSLAAAEIKPGPWGILVANAAAREVIANSQCPVCEGRGMVMPEGADLLTECDSCEGTGVAKWANETRADLIGVTLPDFRRLYYQFHKACLRAIVRAEIETLSSMAYRLNK